MLAVILFVWIGITLQASSWYYWIVGIIGFMKLCETFTKCYELGKKEK